MKYLVARTATFRDRDRWEADVDIVNEVPIHNSRGPASWLGFRHGLWLLRRSRGYDAVAVGRWGAWLPPLAQALRIPTPVVMTDVEWPGPPHGRGALNRRTGQAAWCLCCFTRVEMERYAKHFGVPREKFRFLPLAFQLADISGCTPSDGGYIFAGGNEDRDWETLLRAASGTDYAIRIFAGRNPPQVLPPNATLGRASRKEYHDQMAGASCVVVPTLGRTFRPSGLTAWTNAMAMGKVVIVTGRDGAMDYIEHGVSGYVFDHGDVAGLRACMQKVMRDPALRVRVGAAARERAWREFSPRAYRLGVLALLDEASKATGRADTLACESPTAPPPSTSDNSPSYR